MLDVHWVIKGYWYCCLYINSTPFFLIHSLYLIFVVIVYFTLYCYVSSVLVVDKILLMLHNFPAIDIKAQYIHQYNRWYTHQALVSIAYNSLMIQIWLKYNIFTEFYELLLIIFIKYYTNASSDMEMRKSISYANSKQTITFSNLSGNIQIKEYRIK